MMGVNHVKSNGCFFPLGAGKKVKEVKRGSLS